MGMHACMCVCMLSVFVDVCMLSVYLYVHVCVMRGCMRGWMDGWMGGCSMYECTYASIYYQFITDIKLTSSL